MVSLELAGGGMLVPLWTLVIGAENPGKVPFLRNFQTVQETEKKKVRLQGAVETRQSLRGFETQNGWDYSLGTCFRFISIERCLLFFFFFNSLRSQTKKKKKSQLACLWRGVWRQGRSGGNPREHRPSGGGCCAVPEPARPAVGRPARPTSRTW